MDRGWLGRGTRVFPMEAGEAHGRDGRRGVVDNQERMVEQLERERERVVRTGACCCLALLSVDRLDDAVAGAVMDDIGARLVGSLRPYDDVFRYGPSRFLVSLPHIRAEGMATVMERLRDAVADEPVPLADGRELAVTVSLGCAVMDGQVSLRAVLDRADQALQSAVSAGGDCVRVWTQGV